MSPADRLPPIEPTFGSNPEKPKPDSRKEPEIDLPARDFELEPDAEPPFATMPDLNDRDLQADTLAFEPVGRRRPRNWGWLKLVAILAVVGGGAYGAWRQWGEDMIYPAGDEIPTVRAIDGPLKTRPETPGGVDIPNRDKLVYERLESDKGGSGAAKGGTETLLPRAETPLPPPVAATPPTGPNAEASAESSPQMTADPNVPDDEDKEQASAQDGGAPAPAPSAPAAASAPAAPAAQSPAPPPASAARPTPEQVRAAEKPAPPPPPPAVKSAAPLAEARPAPADGKAYKIQLGAVRTEPAARSEWDKLRKAHASVLDRLSLSVQRADLGQKGIFYRIQAGPFADRASAEDACRELTKQKVPCLLVRPQG